MAYSIIQKPDTDAPDVDYPYGKIRDDDGSESYGTPVNTVVYGDLHQFFSRLMAMAGVVFNGMPDNATNGYQLFVALSTYVSALITTAVNAEASTRSAADTALSNAIILKADIASPALTGTPTAPTQAAGTNNTSISTTAYADAAVAVETSARGAAISSEASTRSAADIANSNAISSEAITRAAADAALAAQNPSGLITTLINIGDWDMVATPTLGVNHGLSVSKIRSVNVLIQDDASANLYTFPYSNSSGDDGGIDGVNSSQVVLSRKTGGLFDNVNFNSTSFNRGYIVITYVP